MTQPQPARTTDASTTIPAELQELAAAIERLPAPYREVVRPAFEKVVDATRRRRQILSLVQDALAELRLDMKYLLFDLEATRRERDEYKRQLRELREGE
ncbi:transcriptional regulator [Thermogutta sp.]|uniref:transcriptional regulator n=1 Tax=Thermogutta sp. TaxID=1962930 RepID=UPI00321FCFF5